MAIKLTDYALALGLKTDNGTLANLSREIRANGGTILGVIDPKTGNKVATVFDHDKQAVNEQLVNINKHLSWLIDQMKKSTSKN